MSLTAISEGFRDRRLATALAGPLRIMEVCAPHTMAIFRHGIRSLLPAEIALISGPGYPVCVTATGDIDRMIALAARCATSCSWSNGFTFPASLPTLSLLIS